MIISISFIVAIAIFLISYIVIISEKIHRTVISIAGAVLMIIFGVITQQQALKVLTLIRLDCLLE